MKRPSIFPKIGLILAGLLSAAISSGQQDDFSTRVGFEQHVNRAIPLDARFADEAGHAVSLGGFFNGKPVILVLAYYGCPNLCTLVLNGLTNGLRDLQASAGSDFDVVVVSIDPAETPALAEAKKLSYVRRYGRSQSGWHFLTGSPEAIHRLTEAVGFRYFQDPVSGQFAHPSGIVVVNPKGTITQYLLGIEYPPRELSRALARSERETPGPLAHNLLLLCFHYDPHSGKYSLAIFRLVQVAGILSVCTLAGGIFLLNRRRRDAS